MTASQPAIGDRLRQWSRGSWTPPVVGGVALMLAGTALSGVISGGGWFGYAALGIGVVVGSGMALRALRVPAILAVFGETAALSFLLTALFATGGRAGFLPTQAALASFEAVLAQAGEQVQSGVPPVLATTPIVCLTVSALGAAAIVVDALIVVAEAPAVAGLVLLSVVAVPAALDPDLLPWWSFSLGAIGFALLLTVGGPHREADRVRRFGSPVGGGSGAAPLAGVVAAVAVVIGLFVGATFTVVGTAGKLPFGDSTAANSVGVRLNPFTSLGGQLRRNRPVELFRVHGLAENVYLTALTLADFNTKAGWSQGPVDRRSAIGASVPLPDGLDAAPAGPVSTVTIEPVGYRDIWLPSYGVPLGFTGEPANSFYDPTSGVAFTQSRQKILPYQEKMLLPQPTPDQLRSAPGASVAAINPEYFHHDFVDPRVLDLAIHLTSGQVTDFDRTLALSHFFTDPINGFNYSLDAGDGSSNDALVNFLFTTKKGFCEQYASAMAVMLRLLEIPSRVVLGFTPGYQVGDERVLTTNDAHAWVEVYFPTVGWTTFDPTPLADGRGQQPSYVVNDGRAKPGRLPDGATNASSVAPTTTKSRPDGAAATSAVAAPGAGSPPEVGLGVLLGRVLAIVLCVAGAGLSTASVLTARARSGKSGRSARLLAQRAAGPALIALGVGAVALTRSSTAQTWLLALLIIVLAGAVCLGTPAVVRATQRGQRTRLVMLRGPGAAAAAWTELRAESSDRGAMLLPTETVRAAARRIAREHHLDEPGRDGLRTIIAVVEREWYGGQPADAVSGAELAESFGAVRDSLRRGAPLSLSARLWPPSVLRPTPSSTD